MLHLNKETALSLDGFTIGFYQVYLKHIDCLDYVLETRGFSIR